MTRTNITPPTSVPVALPAQNEGIKPLIEALGSLAQSGKRRLDNRYSALIASYERHLDDLLTAAKEKTDKLRTLEKEQRSTQQRITETKKQIEAEKKAAKSWHSNVDSFIQCGFFAEACHDEVTYLERECLRLTTEKERINLKYNDTLTSLNILNGEIKTLTRVLDQFKTALKEAHRA